MDIEHALEAVEAIRGTVPVEEHLAFDAELANRLGLASEAVGPLATTEALNSEVVPVPEAITDTTDLRESLLSGFDAAYNT